MTHPRNELEPIFRKLTPIGYDYEDRDPLRFVATGFYYTHQWGVLDLENSDELPTVGPYLVTNKHVVLPDEEPNPDFLTIYTRDSQDVRSTTRHHVSLYDSTGEKKWREHPENRKIDIVLIPLNINLGKTGTFHRGDIPGGPKSISGGEIAQVVGYPEPLVKFHRLPIIRQALISSPYQVAYYDSPFFVIDAKLHDGMSGSPVVYSPGYLKVRSEVQTKSSSWGDGDDNQVVEVEGSTKRERAQLLGVHSEERMRFEDRTRLDDIRDSLPSNGDSEPGLASYLEDIDERLSSIESETGITRVWHAKYIDDIIRNV